MYPYIENLDIGTTVNGSADVYTLLLTARQGDSTFTNLREVTIGEELQIRFQARVGNRLPISVRIERPTKANVLADRGVLQSVC